MKLSDRLAELAAQPSVPTGDVVSAPEMNGNGALPYLDQFSFKGEEGHSYGVDEATGHVIDLSDKDKVVGIDVVTAAALGQEMKLDGLTDLQLNLVLRQELESTPHGSSPSELADRIFADIKRRENERKTTHQGNGTDQMPVVLIPDAAASGEPKRKRRGLVDRVMDRMDASITRMEKTAPVRAAAKTETKGVKAQGKTIKAEAKAARKGLKKLDGVARLLLDDDSRAVLAARRSELETKVGSHQSWRKAQKAERRAATAEVGNMIADMRRGPAEKEARNTAKTTARQERNDARKTLADALDESRRTQALLDTHGRTISADEREFQREKLAKAQATIAEQRERLKANSRRALGRKAREAAEHDAAFDEKQIPSPEAKELFKDLHDKRIKALKLGLESGYKLRKGNRAYRKAYAEYRKAFLACEAATFKYAAIEAGGSLGEDQEKALATKVVVDEIHAMQSWQFQLVTEAQGTRRGRLAMWYHRQRPITKLVLGVSVGMATGGLAGVAGGAAAGVGLAAARVARSQGTRQARGIATQNVRRVTKKDEEKYLAADTTDAAFDLMAGDQAEYVKRSIRRKRLGIAVTAGALVAGHVIGERLNDHLAHKGHSTTPKPQHGGVHTEDPVRVLDAQGVGDHITPTAAHIDTSGIRYPWEYFGNDIHTVAAKAAAEHNVQWHGQGVNAWVSVDGHSDTDTVVNLLNKYR